MASVWDTTINLHFPQTKPSCLVRPVNVTKRHLAIVLKTYTDMRGAIVTSQMINNSASHEVRQTMC